MFSSRGGDYLECKSKNCRQNMAALGPRGPKTLNVSSCVWTFVRRARTGMEGSSHEFGDAGLKPLTWQSWWQVQGALRLTWSLARQGLIN